MQVEWGNFFAPREGLPSHNFPKLRHLPGFVWRIFPNSLRALKPDLGNSWILGTFGTVTPPLLNKQEGDDQVEKPILEDEEDVEANKEHIMRHHLSSTAGICYP